MSALTTERSARGQKVVPAEPKYHSSTLFISLWAANVLMAGLMVFAPIDRLAIGGLGVLLMLGLLVVGIPVGFSMIIPSVLGLWGIGGSLAIAEATLRDALYTSVASWTFAVAPLFVLMGIALWKSGISDRAYEATRQWLGRIPGGLGVATNLAGAGMASTSGSTTAIVMSLGKMAIPEMLKAGYSPAIATGSVAMAGSLGQIIPPSVLLVIYSSIVLTPLGPQMLAGIVPGIILAAIYCATVVVWALVWPKSAPRADMSDVTWRTRFTSLVGVLPLVLVFAIIVGGIFSGWFTVTEAAAIAAVVSLVLACVIRGKGTRSPRQIGSFIWSTVRDSVATIAGLFLILVGAILMTAFIARSGVAQAFSAWLVGLGLDRIGLLLLLSVVFLILGLALESLPIMLVTLPILQAPLEAVGVDMIWFGIYMLIMMELAAVSPPVGFLVFIVHRVAQARDTNLGNPISLITVFKGITPFCIGALLFVIVLIFFPEIALWLPGLASGG